MDNEILKQWRAIAQTKPVCQLDSNSLFSEQTEALPDPMRENRWLLPAGCVDTAPPEARAGFAAQWQPEKQEWAYIPDYRGQTAYRTNNGQPETVQTAGELPPELTLTPRPSEYHVWDGKAWVLSESAAAQALADAQAQGAAQINDAVEAVLQPLTRFEVEYKRREAQARAYRDAGYKGDVPCQVAAFAKPTGKTPKEAADIIIAQADMLYSLLDKLGELRMRKFELGSLKTAAEVETRTAEIVAQIESAAAQLAA
nr:MAG TPA: tail fiber assembly protein [Caudoviricetes sp.]